jgi:hypothetical protein
MMQLLLLTAAAFWIYIDKLGGEATISLDTDWFYRKPGLLLLWFCINPLQNLRLGLQKSLSRMVTGVTSLSRNPILLPQIAIRYLHLKVVNGLYHISGLSEKRAEELRGLESRISELRQISYNENIYRKPIGLGVLLVIILLFFYGLIYYLRLR